jgi:hypothetical protein
MTQVHTHGERYKFMINARCAANHWDHMLTHYSSTPTPTQPATASRISLLAVRQNKVLQAAAWTDGLVGLKSTLKAPDRHKSHTSAWDH